MNRMSLSSDQVNCRRSSIFEAHNVPITITRREASAGFALRFLRLELHDVYPAYPQVSGTQTLRVYLEA